VKDVVKNAVSILSSKSDEGEIPLVLIPEDRSSFSVLLEIPAGCHCLMQRFGKDIGVFQPGAHWFMPSWYRIAYIVSNQACCYDAPVLSCPTSDDVRVSVDVVVVFQITDPQKFIYRLGAKNFDEFLNATVDEAIRMLVRNESHQTVYALRGERAEIMLKKLNDKFIEAGVTFLDVKVVSVWLPDSLANVLEITTKIDKGMGVRIRENEFDMLQISQDSEMSIEEIRRRQEQVLVGEAGRKKKAEMEFDQRKVKAEEEGEVGMIVAKGKIEVDNLRAQTDLERTKMRLEAWRIKQLAEAETKANQDKIGADLQAEEELVRADAELEKMMNDAEVMKAEAGTEAEASKTLAARREHDFLLNEKAILAKLATKGKFNLIGTAGDELVAAMLKGNFDKSNSAM
jgi:regulator of protease activity HflC (stomatin/prohibitin superfamily)